jgi:Rrf2 family protein
MRITRAGEYAVRCILYLAAQERGIVVNRLKIARKMDIPDQFLGKIAQQLAKAGILEIMQGQKGGLRLLLPPEQTNLLQVLEAVMGEIFLNNCVLTPKACGSGETCVVHSVLQKARTQLRETLQEATFEKLLHSECDTLHPLAFKDHR